MTSRPAAVAERQAVTPRVVPDNCRVRIAGVRVDDAVLLSLSKFAGRFDDQGEIYSESASSENLFVQNGPVGLVVAGSFWNWAVATGRVGLGDPYGPAEVGATFAALDEVLGLVTGTVASGRLTKVELAADLVLPRSPAAYVAASEDVDRTTPWRIGNRTVIHRADKFAVKLYDKVEEALAKGRPLPESHVGSHVLRVEHVLHRGGVPRYLGALKDVHGVVRAGVLATASGAAECARVWLGRARALRFRRVAHPALVPESATDRARWHAVQHIMATGGVSAEVARIEADRDAGLLTGPQAKAQKAAVRALCRDPRYSATSDLEGDFAAAVEAVERAHSL